jgi:hypothetical protein
MMPKAGRTAKRSLLGAVVVCVWGAFLVLGVHDIEEICGAYNQHWEFDSGHTPSLFPLS